MKATSGPVSVALPADLKRRVAAEAKRRGLKLSSALRTLAAERLDELADASQLTRAEEWQRAEAWASWERAKAGRAHEVSRAEVDAVFQRPARARR